MEQSWRDVHHKLCTYACDDIQGQLSHGMIARVDERLMVELSPEQSRSIEDETATEAFIEIIDARSGGRVITVIEFISVTNKLPGEGRDIYRRKQLELRSAGVSMAEVNLLRAGPPLPSFPLAKLPVEDRTAYHAVVHRAWAGRQYQVYPIRLPDRLPVIGIPLRETDPVVALDLQSLIDRVYRNGAYDVEIDYREPPRPPLDGQDDNWAAALLKDAGLR